MKRLAPLLEDKDHVIWDWNGTLLSDLEHTIATVNRLLTEESLAPIDVNHHRENFRFPVADYYRTLGFDTTPAVFAAICGRFNAHFHEGLAACALWPGAEHLLAEIKTSGRVQSLLSLTEHELLLSNVAHFGITKLFDHIVGNTDQLAASKVARGRELLSRVDAAPGRTVLIGDTDHDLEVGKALGIGVILVEHGHQSPARLRALHDNVVNVLGGV